MHLLGGPIPPKAKAAKKPGRKAQKDARKRLRKEGQEESPSREQPLIRCACAGEDRL